MWATCEEKGWKEGQSPGLEDIRNLQLRVLQPPRAAAEPGFHIPPVPPGCPPAFSDPPPIDPTPSLPQTFGWQSPVPAPCPFLLGSEDFPSRFPFTWSRRKRGGWPGESLNLRAAASTPAFDLRLLLPSCTHFDSKEKGKEKLQRPPRNSSHSSSTDARGQRVPLAKGNVGRRVGEP